MILIYAAKAEQVGDEEIDDVRLVIEASNLSRERMARDASSIANALHFALPQGTWNRLVAEIAQRWAEHTKGHISAAEWFI